MSSSCLSFYFGSPGAKVDVFKHDGEASVLRVGSCTADTLGIVRWNPGEDGLYDFVCLSNPALSKYLYRVGGNPVAVES